MLDKKDAAILSALQENAKLTVKQLSQLTGYPVTTIHNRIKKLERNDVIQGYTVLLNYKKLGKEIHAYILLTVNYNLPSGKTVNQKDIAEEIKRMPEVEEVKILAGSTDMLLNIRTRDVDELNLFLIDKLRNIEGVDKTQTMIVLSEV